MEDTYALLSKLVQTKSIQRVLAPIAAQVSQLIIINEAYEQGEKDAFPADLVPSASMVQASTQGLVGAASRLAVDSTDQELHDSMPRACELLSVSGQNLVMATQRVQIENFSRESRRHLIRTAKDVLQGTLKVMLVTDDAEIRKLKRAIVWTRDRLGILTAVLSMKNLVPAFKGFTEAVILLTNLVDKRQLELSDPQQREAVLNALAILKKCVPMLNSSLQTYAKYPKNAQAKASKMYVLGQIMSCLEDLENAVHSKDLVSDEYEEPEMAGSFVTNVDRVIEMLSSENRVASAQMGTDLDYVMEGLVRHGMEVAHQSMEHHRSLIIKNAQRLLKQRTQLCEMAANVRENVHMTELRHDFDDASEQMMEETQDLERHVHGAVLQLIVDVYKETTEPLDRMIKAALSENTGDSVSAQTNLEAFMELFHQHSDKMIQVARFTAATSLDAKKVRTINTCVSHLERLDPEIVPAAVACRDTSGDKAAVEHLRLLKKEWASTVNVLVQVIDELIDGKMFIEISECEMRRDVSKCKGSLYCDESAIADVTRSLIGRARRVSGRATHSVDSHADALYRNGVMAFINQLNKAIPAVKSSANSIMEDLGNERHHASFHRRCDALVKHVAQIKDALLGNMLPDLLDPIRNNVRPIRGVGELDLEDDTEEVQDESENTIVQPSDDKKKVHDIVAERNAIKNYIDDVVHSPMSELMTAVTSAAVAGQQQKLDALCGTVLEISNHLTAIADIVSKYCNQRYKSSLSDQAATLVRLSPQVLEKSRQVADCDTYQLDPLHQVTADWAQTVSGLEKTVDTILAKWKAVSDKLIDASKMSNKPLLSAEKKHFEEHKKQVSQMMDTALKLVDTQGIVSQEKIRLLQENASEFGRLTSTLLAMADLHISPGADPWSRSELERSGREWAVKVYSLTSAVDALSVKAVEEIRRRAVFIDIQDLSQLDADLKDITGESMRLKDAIESALNGCTDESRLSEGRSAQQSLDVLCGNIHQCAQLITHVSTPYQTTEKMYAPHTMSLILWQWATEVQETRAIVDRWTAEFTEKMTTFVSDVNSLHDSGSDDSRQTEEMKCRRFVTYFRETLHKIRSRVLDAIQTSDDLDGKNRARRHLEGLTSIAETLEKSAKELILGPDVDNFQQFENTRRQWGIKCLELRGCLMGLAGAEMKVITEAVQTMRLQEQKVKITSFGFQGNKPERNVNKSTISNNTGYSKQCSQNQTEELSATMWMDEEPLMHCKSETFEPCVKGILKLNRPASSGTKRCVSFKQSTTPGSFRDSPQTKSWNELSLGPKVHHHTPSRTTQSAGYRPGSKALQEMSYGSPFNYPLESEKWEDDNNAIVRVARELAHKLQHMTQFSKGQGPIVSKEQLIATARSVATSGGTLVKFAKVLVAHSIDKRIGEELQCSVDRMPTIIAQLNILASVKTAAPDDRSTEKMLVKTTENLVDALNKMLRNAEAACVKGLRQPVESTPDDTQALVLATQWRRRFNRHRLMEYTSTTTDDLGLRKVNRQSNAPALSNIMMQR